MKKILLAILLSLLIFNNAYSNSDYIDKLKKLGEAYKSGLITKEIFESSKKRIIENIKVKQTNSKVKNTNIEIELPAHSIDWNRSDRKENWFEMLNGDNNKFKAWADAISTKKPGNSPAYSFGWHTTNDGLAAAAKRATKTCEKYRKEVLRDYKKHDICIVNFINGLPTNEEEKIKFANKFYGKKRASLAFEKNPFLLLKPKNQKIKKNIKKEPKKVLKKYKIEGKRSIALSWEDYDDLIAGSVNFDETDYKGTLNLSLPNNDGMCDGTYSLQDSGKGTWQITCTNNMGAAGKLKWIKDGGVTGIGKDYNNKIVKFTVSHK